MSPDIKPNLRIDLPNKHRVLKSWMLLALSVTAAVGTPTVLCQLIGRIQPSDVTVAEVNNDIYLIDREHHRDYRYANVITDALTVGQHVPGGIQFEDFWNTESSIIVFDPFTNLFKEYPKFPGEEFSSISPDGTRKAFITRNNFTTFLGVSAVDNSNYHVLATLGSADEFPSWSPNGELLAVVRGDPQKTTHIALVDSETGDVNTLTSGNVSDTQPLFSPDGELVAFVRGFSDILIVDLNKTLVAQVPVPPGGVVGLEAWSGNKIYYTNGGRGARWGVTYDFSSGAMEHIAPYTDPDTSDTFGLLPLR